MANKTDENKSGARGALGNAANTIREMGERGLELNREFSVRVIEYAEKNTTEALTAARSAAQAKSPAELFEIQNNFFRDQLTRSANQLRELGEMIQKANQEAWQPMRDRMSGKQAGGEQQSGGGQQGGEKRGS